MRCLLALSVVLMPFLVQGQSAERIEAVNWKSVTIKDGFWTPRQKALGSTTLPEQFEQLRVNHYYENFQRAADRKVGGFQGLLFNDSDAYKVLEAAAYYLGKHPDKAIDAKCDELIALIGKAQEPDGYLDTYFQLTAPDKKWTNLRDMHELYCAGHLFEAAAVHFQATGKKNLLGIAEKLADHIDRRFGPGKKMGYPGHPETELALFKLWRATGDQKYYNLAEFFLENRGKKFFATEHNTPLKDYNGDYWSDNELIRDHTSIVGHAVRAAYLFCGATDLANETRDKGLTDMLDRVWRSTTEKRMFVTGGIGPSGSNEGFTVDYDLPTFTAYQESCASIANALWNSRMTLLHGDAKYADVMEQAIYNGALAGIDAHGDHYYYVNPLASNGNHQRVPWFQCACCPPNLARLIGQIGGMAYGTSKSGAYVNLYIGGTADLNIAGTPVKLDTQTNWPWSGKVSMTVNPKSAKQFTLYLRVPTWAKKFSVMVKGGKVEALVKDGYLVCNEEWKAGDKVELNIDMPVRKVISHPSVKDTLGQFALARGPLVYCLEGVDNAFDLHKIGVPVNQILSTTPDSSVIPGAVAITGKAFTISDQTWSHRLFQNLSEPQEVSFRAIPYFLWNNRKRGAMRVWLSPNPEPAPVRGNEVDAAVSLSYKSDISSLDGVRDGYVPATSNPNSPQQTHFWNHKGGVEWVQYTFNSPITVSSSRVFWFDDTGRGECKVPKAWKLQAWVNGDWKDVPLLGWEGYGLKLDVYNSVDFKPITSSQFRLVVTQQQGWSSGIHEWQLFSD